MFVALREKNVISNRKIERVNYFMCSPLFTIKRRGRKSVLYKKCKIYYPLKKNKFFITGLRVLIGSIMGEKYFSRVDHVNTMRTARLACI